MTIHSENKKSKLSSRKRSLIEWGIIIGVVAFLYFTGLHTQVLGTMQRGLLATGLIKPSIPSVTDSFPDAGREFYFSDDNGSIHSLADYEGNVIFMNIWATWCPPCIAEMPSIHALYNRFDESDGITFLLVSLDDEFDKAKNFMVSRNFNMPIYHFRGKEPGQYESTVIPTTYVISGDGKLVMEKRGLAKYDTPEFEQFLRDLTDL